MLIGNCFMVAETCEASEFENIILDYNIDLEDMDDDYNISLVYDSRYDNMSDSIQSRNVALGFEYYQIYNISLKLTTLTAPYSSLTYIQAGIAIRVDFDEYGYITTVGTPEYYSVVLYNMAGSPTMYKSISSTKLSSTKYSITASIKVDTVSYPTYTNTFTATP